MDQVDGNFLVDFMGGNLSLRRFLRRELIGSRTKEKCTKNAPKMTVNNKNELKWVQVAPVEVSTPPIYTGSRSQAIGTPPQPGPKGAQVGPRGPMGPPGAAEGWWGPNGASSKFLFLRGKSLFLWGGRYWYCYGVAFVGSGQGQSRGQGRGCHL